MATYIRLTDYKSSGEKEQEFFNPENRYEAKQEEFSKIPASPIAYWVSDNVNKIFDKSKKLGDYTNPRKGLVTGDNEKFVKLWNEVNFSKIGLNTKNRAEGIENNKKWFPYNKGGEFRRWHGNDEYLVNWENDGYELRNTLHSSGLRPISSNYNLDFIFKPLISWSAVASTAFSSRISLEGYMCDAGGSACYPDTNSIVYILSLLNSKLTMNNLRIMNPTLNFQSGNIASLPIIFPKDESAKQKIETLTQQNIDISKEEWDSRETSWNFAQNEILRILNDEFSILNEEKPTLETVYNRYCDYWGEKFFTLHQNEEELNRLFIDIYELQDELTSDVELKDITILKNETKIIDDELVFQADEIMKQFISYGVGVMFGRYSLDKEGLWIANLNQDISMYSHAGAWEQDPTTSGSHAPAWEPSFEIDDDNVIPVLEDDYFKDDIASRFVQFVKATFGEEDLSENIRFIESSLGTTLRKYFVKGFYEDHIKRYKKRPIYWMVASPKKGFMSLIYMHRYEADTFARVRNSYLTEYIAKLEAHKETLALTTSSDTASDKDKKDADKQMKNIDTKLKEIIEFDRDKMMSWSQNPTEIDLDDGVKVNYCKFKEILYPITGLCK